MDYKEGIRKLKLYSAEHQCHGGITAWASDTIETLLEEREARKHGKWEFVREGTYFKKVRAYCSSCGKRSGIEGTIEDQKKPFCPHCGAKMDIGVGL